MAGFTFAEIASARASTNKVICCHFSSDGKLLATGGHDKKVEIINRWNTSYNCFFIFLCDSAHPSELEWISHRLPVDLPLQACLWYTDTLKLKLTLEEHSFLITDVRFSPSMPRLATSSFDKTVRVWDAENVSHHSFTNIFC